MALNPNLLNSLPNALVDMYSVVESDILQDMARRISTYNYFIPAALHQNQKLQELGLAQEMIIKKLSSLTRQTQAEIVDLLSEASAEAVADDVEYYTRAEVYKPDKVNTEALHAQLNSGLLQTQNAFFNITRTTANTASRQFELTLDKAWTQINVGGMDYNTAIKNAITDLAEAGVGSIKYKSGRIDNIEVAVRRAIVTGANQTAMRTQEVLADELEVDLVEVTAHGGARPSHAKWQGQVYGRKGRVTIDGVTYEDLAKATGYGRADGLGGVNCRHNFHPYVPGTSRAWDEKALEELEAKKFEYNGGKYTEYEANQIQRGIEREIRKQKRTVAALEAAGQDSSAEQKKLREAQKSYTDFTDQTGIRKQSARTQIASAKAEREVKNANKAAGVETASVKDIQEQRETVRKISARQEDDTVAVPERYKNNFDDFRELQIDRKTETSLRDLQEQSKKDGAEYAVVVQGGKVGKPFTSNERNRVAISLDDYSGKELEIYHSHTNVTPPSAEDFSFLLNSRVAKIGNIAYNDDVFIVSVDNGWIPTKEEFNEEVSKIKTEVNIDIMNDPDFAFWTPAERNYAAIREQAYRIARAFEWTIEGGNLNE